MSNLDCAYATLAAPSLARFVADRFPFGPVTCCRLLQRGFNDLYVAEAGGRRAVLRLSRAGRRRTSDLEYEASLLAYLRSRGVPVVAPRCGRDGRYCQSMSAPEGTRFALLFDFITGREPEETPADAYAQGAVLARIHAETAGIAIPHDRFILDLEHLLHRPLAALCALLGDRSEARRYLTDLADRLHRLVCDRAGALSWVACHGDCHGFNARFGAGGDAILFDFDDGGPGWRAYDLAVFLWSARAGASRFMAALPRRLSQPKSDPAPRSGRRGGLRADPPYLADGRICGRFDRLGHAVARCLVRSPDRLSEELGRRADRQPARTGLNPRIGRSTFG
jgi:Ser/Thr protein kinase RdoA (MazF antagonist)